MTTADMDSGPAGSTTVELRVDRLRQYFDLERIMGRKISNDQIVDYYKKSSIGYALFHSKQGSIHMALNPDGKFSEEGYYRAPKIAWEYLGKNLPVKRVLELGCGSGFNLEVISARSPAVDFAGIDLTPKHVANAQKRLRGHHNVEITSGDFHHIEYPQGSFGGAYSIESFCHATDPKQAFQSLRRVLRPGAPFVVIDAWRTELTRTSSPRLLEDLSLTERSMAVSKTMLQSQWLELATSSGFQLERRLELSAEVMPNLERFEGMAERFMNHGRIARFAGQILKLRLLENVIAGYLMAESVRSGFHTYDALVLKAA